jgi:RNA polymerase sigma-70 factor, ECF subfamily
MVENERDLLQLLHNGDSGAFERLFLEYSSKIFNFSKRLLNNTDDAREVVQQTFVAVWENHVNIDPSKSFSSYLYTCARNLIINSYKRKVYFRAYTEYILFKEKDFYFVTDSQVLYNELEANLHKIIEELPEKRKEIFLLSRNEGLSYKEIAERLCISESTVNTQITKAIGYIKKKLEFMS